MTRQLHLLTAPPDDYVRTLLQAVQGNPQLQVEVLDLTGDQPDYDRLVEAIFLADAIASW